MAGIGEALLSKIEIYFKVSDITIILRDNGYINNPKEPADDNANDRTFHPLFTI